MTGNHKKGFGTINIGSRLTAENAVSREIDRIIADRLMSYGDCAHCGCAAKEKKRKR